MSYFVYILKSARINKYYIGQTKDLLDRIKRHNSGRERYTSKGVPWGLVFYEEVENRIDAVRLERKIKNFKSHKRLEEYIDKEIKEGRGCREL